MAAWALLLTGVLTVSAYAAASYRRAVVYGEFEGYFAPLLQTGLGYQADRHLDALERQLERWNHYTSYALWFVLYVPVAVLGLAAVALAANLREAARRAGAPLLAGDSRAAGWVVAAALWVVVLLGLLGRHDVMGLRLAGASNLFLLTMGVVAALVGAALLYGMYLLVRYVVTFASVIRQARQLIAEHDRAAA